MCVCITDKKQKQVGHPEGFITHKHSHPNSNTQKGTEPSFGFSPEGVGLQFLMVIMVAHDCFLNDNYQPT